MLPWFRAHPTALPLGHIVANSSPHRRHRTARGDHAVGSRGVLTRGRKQVVGVVVAAMTVSVGLAGLTATPAAAADTIAFRASAQSAGNQPTQRVTIPASVQATDGLLLFVTTQQGRRRHARHRPGWTLVGTRLASTDTETYLYSKVAVAARRRPERRPSPSPRPPRRP